MIWARRNGWGWLLGIVLMLAGSSARADLTWTVTLDTSQLASDYTGPFGLDFELVGNAGNTVTVSGFTFGGGSAGSGGAFVTGGASGDLGSVVTLNDSTAFFSDFNQQFAPGTTLSFTVDSSLVAPASGRFPDNFSLVVFSGYDPVAGYDPSTLTGGTPLPTTDPTGNDTLLNLDVNGPGATMLEGYAGSNGDLAITVTGTSAVPEKSTGVLFVLGLLGLAGARTWHRGR